MEDGRTQFAPTRREQAPALRIHFGFCAGSFGSSRAPTPTNTPGILNEQRLISRVCAEKEGKTVAFLKRSSAKNFKKEFFIKVFQDVVNRWRWHKFTFWVLPPSRSPSEVLCQGQLLFYHGKIFWSIFVYLFNIFSCIFF